MSYFKDIHISENVAHVSALNSNAGPIPALTTWIGTYEEVVNQSGIQLISKFDQETLICVCQSVDGNAATSTITDHWNVDRDTGFSQTVVSAAPYYRITVQNLSNTAATGSIVSAATTIINPLPRSLSEEDGLNVTIQGIHDSYGFEAKNTLNGELRAIEPFRLAGTQFDGTTLDANFWSNTGSGTATVSGDLTLNTTTVANGASTVTTVRFARYVSGAGNRFRSQIQFGDTGTANNSRKIGVINATDGAYYELDGTSFYVVTLKGGSATRVLSDNWNGDRTLPTLKDCNTFEIYYNNKKVYYTINDRLVHTVTATSAIWSNTLHLPIKISTVNTGGSTTACTIKVRTASIYRLGRDRTENIYKHISGVASTLCKSSPGTLHSVVVNSPGTLCSVYDAVSATNAIAIIDTSKTTGIVSQAQYNCPFFTGLYVVTTGAGSDVTIIYE